MTSNDVQTIRLHDQRHYFCNSTGAFNDIQTLLANIDSQQKEIERLRGALTKIGHYSFGYEKVDSIAPFKMNMKDIHRFSQEALAADGREGKG